MSLGAITDTSSSVPVIKRLTVSVTHGGVMIKTDLGSTVIIKALIRFGV